MRLGISVRTMGPESTHETLVACARAAETVGLDEIYVPDHIAIPPDDSEGSGGRYLDPLTALTWMAAHTRHIGLGTGVLILPYRPPLPTAKAIATLQELCGNRFTALGVGVGWMAPEFRALGLSLKDRARDTDRTLEFLVTAFGQDVVEQHGQKFLFLPRPKRPAILIGGAPPHALARAARYGDGWMPIGAKPADLAAPVAELRKLFADAGKPTPELAVFTRLPLDQPDKAVEVSRSYAALGATRLIHANRYQDAGEFARSAETIASRIRPALA